MAKISRHKNLNTIKNHYDPGMTVGKRLNMASSIWGKTSKKPDESIEEASTEYDPGEGTSGM